MKNFSKILGPGILFASTAIGVSHLVQSTRAGANYGFSLLIFIILANLLKYPFFEYGSRYANATGSSIIEGYKKIGNWMLGIYILITLASMFFVTAAVAAVTAGFMDNLFNISSWTDIPQFAVILSLGICTLILIIGKFNLLDKLIKLIGIILLVSTIIAFIMTLINGPKNSTLMVDNLPLFDGSEMGLLNLGFLISLMGWMPTAVDLSAWNSLWTVERIKDSGYKPTLKETLIEFRIGYILSAILSICFVTLGAFLMFNTGESMPEKPGEFSFAVIKMYTSSIGNWSFLIISSAAFSIMFSTCIAVLDGYGRSLKKCIELTLPNKVSNRSYTYSILIVSIGAFAIIFYFMEMSGNPKGFKKLIDLATAISFIIAPVIAIANFHLVSKKHIKSNHVPNKFLKILSWIGILFLLSFSVVYLLN